MKKTKKQEIIIHFSILIIFIVLILVVMCIYINSLSKVSTLTKEYYVSDKEKNDVINHINTMNEIDDCKKIFCSFEYVDSNVKYLAIYSYIVNKDGSIVVETYDEKDPEYLMKYSYNDTILTSEKVKISDSSVAEDDKITRAITKKEYLELYYDSSLSKYLFDFQNAQYLRIEEKTLLQSNHYINFIFKDTYTYSFSINGNNFILNNLKCEMDYFKSFTFTNNEVLKLSYDINGIKCSGTWEINKVVD